MICSTKAVARFLAAAAFALSAGIASQAQTKPLLVTQKIDDNVLVTLGGNTRPEANSNNDMGLADDETQLDHMLLLLQRPPALEAQNNTLNERHAKKVNVLLSQSLAKESIHYLLKCSSAYNLNPIDPCSSWVL